MQAIQRFLISPPFGNWITYPGCSRVRGSFTWERRPGLLWHALRSFRPINGGWINQIGLRNRGLKNIKFQYGEIYSIAGLEDGDWQRMLEYLPSYIIPEINLGCRNVHNYTITPSILKAYCEKFPLVIVKLSPTDDVDEQAVMSIEAGASFLHLSNTVPTLNGGISGKLLLIKNLPIVYRMAHRYPGQIIAGGGIYSPETLSLYQRAGATHFSLATVWLTPWRVKSIIHSISGFFN